MSFIWTPDPMTEGESELDAREDEAIREQRWVEFVAECQSVHASAGGWEHLILMVADAMDGGYSSGVAPLEEFKAECLCFAETEGWHGVLTAIGRAMREESKQ